MDSQHPHSSNTISFLELPVSAFHRQCPPGHPRVALHSVCTCLLRHKHDMAYHGWLFARLEYGVLCPAGLCWDRVVCPSLIAPRKDPSNIDFQVDKCQCGNCRALWILVLSVNWQLVLGVVFYDGCHGNLLPFYAVVQRVRLSGEPYHRFFHRCIGCS